MCNTRCHYNFTNQNLLCVGKHFPLPCAEPFLTVAQHKALNNSADLENISALDSAHIVTETLTPVLYNIGFGSAEAFKNLFRLCLTNDITHSDFHGVIHGDHNLHIANRHTHDIIRLHFA